MKELKVSFGESNQRLNKYLMKYLNQAPSSFIYKMLRKKNITLNGKKATGDEIVLEGDTIKLFLSEETIEKFKHSDKTLVDCVTSKNTIKLKILYQDKDIIAVHKPAGILSQKATNKDISINEMIIDYCKDNNLTSKDSNLVYKPSVCNRLDRNTSGIILAGITLHGSQRLSSMLKEHNMDKFYYTIVKGTLKNTIHSKAYITKDTKENISCIISDPEYKKLDSTKKAYYNYVETVFEPLSGNGKYTLLKVKLLTGKSHQIRATLKFLNYPIIGDTKYGDNNVNSYFKDKYKLKHHLLHAGIINFKDLTIKDELPDIFKKICLGENINICN